MKSWLEFESRLKKRHPGIVVQAVPRIGSTNSARFLGNGMKVGIPNLRSRAKLLDGKRTGGGWAFAGKFLLPGLEDSELFIALVFKGNALDELLGRLEQIEGAGDAESPKTNNTRLVLHASGFYANVLAETEDVDPLADPDGYGLPIAVTEILFADVERDGQLTPAEIDVVARLKRNYVRPEIVVRLDHAGIAISPVARPENLGLDELFIRVRELGGFYSSEILQTLHLNLTHNPVKHFVVLRGISGTGKSRLAKSYAYAVLGAASLQEEHKRFVVVPVEPQWTDPTYLVGHEDVLSAEGYARTPFLEALLLANSDPLQPVFVLLDEMNRAQVEHYFSNFLSAMEIEGPIGFHTSSSSETRGVPASIRWPSNLYLIGTINDDESVIPFSPMVLDRANSQDLSAVDVRAYSAWLRNHEPSLGEVLSARVIDVLAELSDILRPFQLHFGNRTVREVALFVEKAREIGSSLNALDVQIDQKILPKVRGGEEMATMLAQMALVLSDFPVAGARVLRMQSDLQSVDFFKYR